MKVEQKITFRLQSLIEKGENVLNSKFTVESRAVRMGKQTVPSYAAVNIEICYEWQITCLYLLKNIFGEKSIHFIEFKKVFEESKAQNWSDLENNRNDTARKAFAILKAAKDDYENGYLFDTRALIEAEVFDDFLEQAEHLFKKDYYQPAAVIAGCVLEDGLRKLCARNSITLPAKATIEPMNVELAKTGIYNKLVQKKITALADLRNKAAHGEWSEFTKNDVEDMIRNVRRFMEDYFS
jgi:hypothetical protein